MSGMEPVATKASAVLLSRDEAVQDAVLAAGAAAGHEVSLVATPDELLADWAGARAVFIGADLAASVAALAPARRDRVHLVGEDATELARWSMVLGATISVIPHGSALLTDAFLAVTDSDTPVVALVGGAGGVGTSTVAVGLAQVSGRPSLVIDADSDGGGLDLVVGLEVESGWRWPELARARGHLGELRGHLPRLDDLEVLAVSRDAQAVAPTAEALPAVLDAARRSHDLVVIDAGRARCPLGMSAVQLADVVLVVTRLDVRAAAAARARTEHLNSDRGRVAGLVLREAPGAGLSASEVADALGVPVWAQFPHDRGILAAGLRGGPPNRAAGRRWRKACLQLRQRVQQ